MKRGMCPLAPRIGIEMEVTDSKNNTLMDLGSPARAEAIRGEALGGSMFLCTGAFLEI